MFINKYAIICPLRTSLVQYGSVVFSSIARAQRPNQSVSKSTDGFSNKSYPTHPTVTRLTHLFAEVQVTGMATEAIYSVLFGLLGRTSRK